MKRALAIALLGLAYFVISVMFFIPLRMKPIPNYNLFFFSLLTIIFLFLFYRACTHSQQLGLKETGEKVSSPAR
jgi:hypothetical protein